MTMSQDWILKVIRIFFTDKWLFIKRLSVKDSETTSDCCMRGRPIAKALPFLHLLFIGIVQMLHHIGFYP